jgi:hypothetical protein
MTEEQVYKIESMSLRDSIDWNEINDVFFDYKEVISAIDYFLLHLTSNHLVPGKVYHKLIGIGDNIKEHKSFTDKQARYVVLALAGYWSEIDPFKELL